MSDRVLRVRVSDSAEGFFRLAGPFLLEAEAENSLILGVLGGLLEEPNPSTRPYFAAVMDDDGTVSLAAFQTLATKLGITRSRHPGAVPLLAAEIAATRSTVIDLLGPEPTITELATAVANARGGRAERRGRRRRPG